VIILGLQDCKSCKDLKERHPDLPYLELPRKGKKALGIILQVKKLLGKNRVSLFPVLLDDELESILSIKETDPEYWKDHQSLI